MKAPPFEYAAPESLQEALELLAEHGDDAKVLAGGQSLVPLLAFRLARPSLLIDLRKLSELRYIASDEDRGLRIGAMTTMRSLERSAEVTGALPLMAEAMVHIGHPQIRNRGTIGGSLAHADPAAELPAVAVAHDATMVAHSVRGSREVPARDFFWSYLTTALDPDEIVTDVAFDRPRQRSGHAFMEVSRRHGDFALVSAAGRVVIDSEGMCEELRLVLGGAGGTVLDRSSDCDELIGRPLSDDLLDGLAGRVREDLNPPSDVHAGAEYRRQVAGTLATRALARAYQRATEKATGTGEAV